MINNTASQQATAASRGTEPATATPSPSSLAAGTSRRQIRHSAAREAQTARPTNKEPARPWTSSPIATACRPNTMINTTTPIGPTSPRRIAVRDRSAVHPDPNPSIVSASPSRCNARLPSARPPTTSSPTASGCRPAAWASQPSNATAAASGSTASGAMIMARAAVRPSISAMLPDGTIVSVPTDSRSASSMIASADGDEISKQGEFAQHEDRRAQYRERRQSAGAFTKSQTKIENWFQAQLVKSQLLCWFGRAVTSRAPRDYARLQVLGDAGLRDRDDPVEQHRYAALRGCAKEANPGGNIGRAQRRKPIDRVLRAITDSIERLPDHLSLVPEPIIIHSAPAPDDLVGLQAETRRHQRCGW